MKIWKILVLFMLVVGIAVPSFGSRAAKSDIWFSAHNLMNGATVSGLNASVNGVNATGTWTTASYGLCSFCHIAHKFGRTVTAPGYLLWNHQLSSQTYQPYSSDTMVATPSAVDASVANNPTALCLSCHDGTVAINSFYEDIATADYSSTVGAASKVYMMDDTTVADLTKQHPVNFVYPNDANAANIGLKTSTLVSANGNVPLPGGKMQCDTCHDPHAGPKHYDGTNTADYTGSTFMGNHLFFRLFPVTSGDAVMTTGSFCVYCHL